MPEIRTATVLHSYPACPGFHIIVASADGPLGALPGQWGAFHTDVPNPAKPGEVLRRAWSFASVDETRFRLYVAVVGAGSRWLADRTAGQTLRFTGPWGTRFRLDEGEGPAAFFAVGSGISPIGAMIDACLARGRRARLLWETPEPAMKWRLERWADAGVAIEVGARLDPRPDDATWWLAGDGARLDEVLPRFDAPPERVERFYTPRPVKA